MISGILWFTTNLSVFLRFFHVYLVTWLKPGFLNHLNSLYRAKLECFKYEKKYLIFFKTHYLSAIYAMV